ncbi:MAG TPA: hypothetical protein VKB79_07550 [Bryobacteraceae bacterium]|nr:hypothetical protein [Bryobacteraceae bacterium]
MKIRFQADADIDPAIRNGLLRREPTIDFQSAAGVIPDGTPDAGVLQIAADDRRVLVSRDLRTMRVHFDAFVAVQESPGVLLIPSTRSVGTIIEGLLFVWLNWTSEDLRNLVQWLPWGPAD